MHEYEFTFDELPLLTRQGFVGALLEGSAVISYELCDGYMGWDVERFLFDGYKVGKQSKPLTVTAESDPELFKLLAAALDEHCGERIVDTLIDEMEAA